MNDASKGSRSAAFGDASKGSRSAAFGHASEGSRSAAFGHASEGSHSGDAVRSARVQVLPDALANQIAAGEVVERPASVVKELVENAIDAGASRILVDIEEAGRGLVRVVDDGSGMSPEDARLAVLRHATSKVSTAEDLIAIGTLGFRGEALPSIASVSRFTLVTRRAEDDVATAIKIEGGNPPVESAAASPVGTRIEVRDLFWNVPARLKFLKTDQTETQHVVELIKSFALGYPQIHFRLGTGAKVAVDFPAVRKLFERVVQVLGQASGKHLYEVHMDAAQPSGRPIRVTGFVSNAREAKATQTGMTTFVNGRRVKDRTIAHAIVSAYGSDIAPGRFPQAVLWLHIDPAEVDVNVHPAKAEVRFRQPQLVHEAVTRALQAMLIRRPWLSDPLPLDAPAVRQPDLLSAPLMPRPSLAPYRQVSGVREEVAPVAPVTAPEHRTELRFGQLPERTTPFAGQTSVPHALRVAPTPRPTPGDEWRLLGHAKGYAVAVGARGLVMFEPQALLEAHIAMTLREAARPVMSQPLLLPGRLDLAATEAPRLARQLSRLADLGVHIEPFGGMTYQLLGLPLPALQASPTLVLNELARSRELSDATIIDTLARLAARAAADRNDLPMATLIDFIPSALEVKAKGLFLLTEDELGRRLGHG